MKIDAIVLATGGNTTGIEIPQAAMEELAGGRRPGGHVTINGFSYRTSIASMGGKYLLPVSAERRAAAGLKVGDRVELDLTLDQAAREIVVPADLAAALAAEPAARAVFDGLAYGHKQRHLLPIEAAGTPETRARRIAKAVETLKAGG